MAAVVALIGVALVAWVLLRPQTNAGEAVRFEVGPSEGMQFFYGGAMAVSPDGRWMVFPAIGADGVSRYWIRSLGTVEARALPGTETAYVPAAWSWDSRYVIFNTLNSRQLRRVDIQGGPPQTLSDAESGLNGLSSSESGGIVFGVALPRPLFRVPAGGGTPVAITALAAGEGGHKFPQFLPDGGRFLYLRVSNDPKLMGVYVGSIDAKPEEQSSTRLLASNRQAYYASSGGSTGHLIFLRDATLMAQPFDPVALEFRGDAVPIAENVDSFTAQSYGLFAVSDSGTLVYRSGAGSKNALVWFDQNGNPGASFSEPGDYGGPAVSPDQMRVAVARGVQPTRDIWVVDATRSTMTRFTFDPADDFSPVWSPDGKSIVFASNRTGPPKIYIKPADGSGEERLLTDMPGIPTSWANDGRFLLFTSNSPKTANDLWAMPDPQQTSTSKPFAVLATQFNEAQGQFSPDGRWIAYTSNESSFQDVFVRAFSPDGNASAVGGKWLVSSGGLSALPRWSADGRQLFYTSAATFGLMAVDVDTHAGFQVGTARRLFTAPPPLGTVGWSPASDGRRFLFITTPNGGRTAPFTVVVNWAATLKQ